jgi:hypothetical protein
MMLRKQNGLAIRRSPAFEQSVVARVMMIIGACFMIFYLIFLGVMMALPATESHHYTILLVMVPLWLTIDFCVRFAVQQTPSVVAKPYLLQPIPFYYVVETYLVNTLITGYNLTWLALYLPYAVIILFGGASFFLSLSVIISGLVLTMANSQFYLMVRTLVGRSLLWWFLPLLVYGGFWVLLPINEELFDKQMDLLSDFTSTWYFPLFCIALLAGMFYMNRWMQFRFVREEMAKQEKKETALKKVSQFTFFERFGQTGEYLKLELKSIMRNKAIRSRFKTSLMLIVVFTLLISFSSIYDSRMMLNFWCFYCFGIYGMSTLVKVMGPEGNYIDLLMTNKENSLMLLKAKYYIHVAILIVPLLLMLPAVIAGKFSPLMMLAYLLLSSGMLYFILFQLAVYNKQTLPLNEKITGRNNVENGIQLIIQMVAILTPLVLVSVLILLFNEDVAYIVLSIIGLLFTLAHPIWLRHIYVRMMKRKYENLEGFRASR